MTVETDVVIVGASPIFLLEAIFRSDSGQQVVVIDQEHAIGGAWAVGSALGFDDIEMSCHSLDYDRAGNAALHKIFSGDLAPVSRAPFNVVFREGIEVATYVQDYSRFQYRANVDRLIAPGRPPLSWLYAAIDVSLSLTGMRHLYFSHGAAAMLARLGRAIAARNIRLELGQKVNRIAAPAPGALSSHSAITVTDRSGRVSTLRASHAIISARTQVQELAVGDKILPIGMPHKAKAYHHCFLYLKSTMPSRYEYVTFHKHPRIFRSHNLTNIMKRCDKIGQLCELHVVHLHSEPDSGPDFARSILSELISLRIIHDDAILLASDYNKRLLHISNRSLISRSKLVERGNISLLKTENLCASIGAHAERWRSLAERLAI